MTQKSLLCEKHSITWTCKRLIQKFIPSSWKVMYSKIVAWLRYQPRMREIEHTINDQKRIYLIGTPEHRNLGDHAIAYGSIEFFQDQFPDRLLFEIPMYPYLGYRKKLTRFIRQEDILVISGGGWMGNIWPDEHAVILDAIRRFPRNKIVVLPQTIWFSSNPNTTQQLVVTSRCFQSHPDVTLCLREQASYEIASELNLTRRLLVPDMCLYLNQTQPKLQRSGILLCFRDDRERIIPTSTESEIVFFLERRGLTYVKTSTLSDTPVRQKDRIAVLNNKFEEFRGAQLVFTDRLHAMLFCVITGTPCIAFDNLSHKVSGVYKTLPQNNKQRVVEHVKDALTLFDEMIMSSDTGSDFPLDYSMLIQAIRE